MIIAKIIYINIIICTFINKRQKILPVFYISVNLEQAWVPDDIMDRSLVLKADIAHVLEGTGCIGRVYVVPLGDYQREISLTVPPQLRVIMYRRLMFKVAQEIARREGAKALVTGESLGQVASQTLDNIRCTDAAVDMPVFRPLIGTDKLENIVMAQQVGTLEIPSPDPPGCFTSLMPRTPATPPQPEHALEAAAALPRA